jgi:hypothetical protein
MDPGKLIPPDLTDFLHAGKQLEYDTALCEAGVIVLKSPDELSVSDVYVDSEESPLRDSDPNAGVEGYYAVPAVSLVAECEGYDPDGILIWLPDYSLYGTWDSDHWDVLVFPQVAWSDIVGNPVPYLNALWEHGVECEYLAPWGRHEFNRGRPW